MVSRAQVAPQEHIGVLASGSFRLLYFSPQYLPERTLGVHPVCLS